jgi:hypothetical protein
MRADARDGQRPPRSWLTRMPSSVRNVHDEPYRRSSWRSLSVWPGRPQRPATTRYCSSPAGCTRARWTHPS